MSQGGSTRTKYQQSNTKKKAIAHSIEYMPQYQAMPLVLLRMQDYMMYNKNRNSIPQEAAPNLTAYMNKACGSAQPQNTMMGGTQPGIMNNSLIKSTIMFGNTNNTGIGNTTGSSLFNPGNTGISNNGVSSLLNNNTTMFGNPGTMNNLNMPNSRNIPIPGSNALSLGGNNNISNSLFPKTVGPQNQGGGLFNINTNNTGIMGGSMNQTPGTSLLGNNTLTSNNTMGQNSMFNKPAGGGLFNTGNTGINKPTIGGINNNTSSLFNTNNNNNNGMANKGNGLFNPPTQNTVSSMFGNNAQGGTNNGGLFNNNKPNTSSLFGNGQNNTVNKPAMGGSSLFGNFNQPGGGLLNNNTNNNMMKPQSSMGGVYNAPAVPNQGMSMSNPMQNQNTMMMPGVGAMKGGYAMVCLPLNSQDSQSTGIKSNTGQQNNNQSNIDNLMKALSQITGNKVPDQAQNRDSINSILDQFSKFDTNHYSVKSCNDKRDYNNDNFYDSILSMSQYDGPFAQENHRESFIRAKTNSKKLLNSLNRKRKKKLFSKKYSKRSTNHWDTSFESSLKKSHFNKPEEDQVVTETLVLPSELFMKDSKKEIFKSSIIKNKPQGKSIHLDVILDKFGKDSKWTLQLNENDFTASILDELIEMKLYKEANLSQLTLLFKEQTLPLDQRIKDSTLQSGDIVYVYKKSNVQNYFAEMTVVPRNTKENLKFLPDFVDLCRMTENELKSVENFSIENEFGKIQFMEPVDLRNADFDKIVKIEHKYIEVYGDDAAELKPKKGEGLNNPAIIYFYNFKKKKSMTDALFLTNLKKYARKMKADFLGYDQEKFTVSIMVNHF